MDPHRSRLLAQLLREMREQNGDYFPEEVWLEIHKTFTLPYVELIIPRRIAGRWEVFLTLRSPTDPDWPSTWHVPGGLWRTMQTQLEACQSVAVRELGIELGNVQEIMTYKWTAHPRGNPISHVCLCWPKRTFASKVDGKFFSELPTPFIQEEIEFVEKALRYLEESAQRCGDSKCSS